MHPNCLPDIAPGVIFGLMSEVTRILSAIEQGQPEAAGKLLPLVYDALRHLAAQFGQQPCLTGKQP
jgi:hypothetical protein